MRHANLPICLFSMSCASHCSTTGSSLRLARPPPRLARPPRPMPFCPCRSFRPCPPPSALLRRCYRRCIRPIFCHLSANVRPIGHHSDITRPLFDHYSAIILPVVGRNWRLFCMRGHLPPPFGHYSATSRPLFCHYSASVRPMLAISACSGTSGHHSDIVR